MTNQTDLENYRQQRETVLTQLAKYQKEGVRAVNGEPNRLFDTTDVQIAFLQNQLSQIEESIAILEEFEGK